MVNTHAGQTLTLHPEPLRRAAAGAFPSEASTASGADGWGRRFANDEQNSRLSARLPVGPWSIQWQQAINVNVGGQAYANILQTGEHLLVFAGADVKLWDLKGEVIGDAGAVGADPLLLEAEGYILSAAGSAYRFSDLKEAWSAPAIDIPQGIVDRRWMSLKNQMITMAWSLGDYDHHTGYKKEMATIVSVEAKPGFPHWKPEQNFNYLDVIASQGWDFASYPLVVAGHGDRVIMAIPGALIQADRHLTLQKTWLLPPGANGPLSLSLDEAGRVYYLSRPDNQHVRLSVIDPAGAIVLEKELAAAYADGFWGATALPPLISFDHHVILRLNRRWVCLDLKGNVLWERAYGPPSGATAMVQPPTDGLITGDNKILFAEGTRLLARSMGGQEFVLHDFAPAKIMAQPVLAASGAIIVATEAALISLKP